jgi:drug/metabolite transporter (DMT)-like permease
VDPWIRFLYIQLKKNESDPRFVLLHWQCRYTAPMNWFGLTLLSAFALATADALSKRYLTHYRPGELVMVRLGAHGALLLLLLLAQPCRIRPGCSGAGFAWRYRWKSAPPGCI